jgi:ADP-ribose pyrophosphatase YjhB (NUDIX family)
MLRLIPAPLHRQLYRTADAVRKLWWRVRQPQLTGVAVIATDLHGHLLLVRMSYGSGSWNLPTGGVGRGENLEDAARRELLEETGCTAGKLHLLGTQEDRLFGTDNIVHVYSTKVAGPPIADMREVIEAKFFPTHSLPEPLTATTRRRLELLKSET